MNKEFGVVVIGYGGMGKRHAKLLSSVEGIIVRGIYDILAERQEEAKNNGYFPYASFEEVLIDPKVEILVIATPNHLHKEIAIEAMQAGKHVICEKPVTTSSANLKEMIATADRSQKLFVVHQNRRWDEDFRVIKKIHEEKIIGDIYSFEARVQGSRGIPGDWRKVAEFGGGMLLDWGVHLIDQILFMVREKVKTVYCKLSFARGEEVDDGFKIFLTFESGKTALLDVGTWNFITLPKWYVCGTNGTVTVTDWYMNGRIVKPTSTASHDAIPVETAAGLTKTMAPRDQDTLIYEDLPRIESDVRDFYRNVIATLKGKSEIIVRNSEVMRVMKLIETAKQSDQLKKVVEFE